MSGLVQKLIQRNVWIMFWQQCSLKKKITKLISILNFQLWGWVFKNPRMKKVWKKISTCYNGFLSFVIFLRAWPEIGEKKPIESEQTTIFLVKFKSNPSYSHLIPIFKEEKSSKLVLLLQSSFIPWTIIHQNMHLYHFFISSTKPNPYLLDS